jgi:myo-inositol catabolism protein IolC
MGRDPNPTKRPERARELRCDLTTRTTERDTALDENNLLKELLNTYRNTSLRRTIPSVIVMDNASFNHTEQIEQMCADAGVKLVHLPQYLRLSSSGTGIHMKTTQSKALICF